MVAYLEFCQFMYPPLFYRNKALYLITGQGTVKKPLDFFPPVVYYYRCLWVEGLLYVHNRFFSFKAQKYLMVGVAQLVRALGCGPSGRGFESLHSPQKRP